MAMYLSLVKLRAEASDDFVRSVKNWPASPMSGINLGYTANVFGNWDCAIWFDADSHDNAISFIQNKVRKLPGVQDTYTLPTTEIKSYMM